MDLKTSVIEAIWSKYYCFIAQANVFFSFDYFGSLFKFKLYVIKEKSFNKYTAIFY